MNKRNRLNLYWKRNVGDLIGESKACRRNGNRSDETATYKYSQTKRVK